MPMTPDMQSPAITPKSTQGGGAALPPYLQMRQPAINPTYPGQQTQPVITPKSTAVPGEVKPMTPPASPVQANQAPQTPPTQGSTEAPAPPQAGGSDLGGLYKFYQSDLANQRNQALAGTRADASARGVFYGTPLTGSEADINTQYLRGLGQLQAGMYGNEQQNQLARLGLAESMGWQNQANQPPMPGQMDWSSLGSLFGTPGQKNSTQPTTPAITPRVGPAGGKSPTQPQYN